MKKLFFLGLISFTLSCLYAADQSEQHIENMCNKILEEQTARFCKMIDQTDENRKKGLKTEIPAKDFDDFINVISWVVLPGLKYSTDPRREVIRTGMQELLNKLTLAKNEFKDTLLII